MTVNFEDVYDYFAVPLSKELVPKNQPFLAFHVQINDGEFERYPFPQQMTSMFMRNKTNSAMFAQLVHEFLAEIADENTFIVLIGEAHFKACKTEKEAMNVNLADDPDCDTALIINIFHVSDTKMGFMPINADRSIKYQPLLTGGIVGGIMSNNPAPDDYPKGTSFH